MKKNHPYNFGELLGGFSTYNFFYFTSGSNFNARTGFLKNSIPKCFHSLGVIFSALLFLKSFKIPIPKKIAQTAIASEGGSTRSDISAPK